MRGFERRTDVAEATRLIDERVRPLTSETIELMSAGGRVLARDLASPVDVPAFRRAATNACTIDEGRAAAVLDRLVELSQTSAG